MERQNVKKERKENLEIYKKFVLLHGRGRACGD